MLPPGTLLSDCEGLIDQIAFALPDGFFRKSEETWQDSPLRPIGNLLQSFPAEVEAVVAVDGRSYALACVWIEAIRPSCRIRIISNDHPTHVIESPWLQDRFHIRAGSDRTTPEILSLNGDPIAALFAKECGLTQRDLEFELPGGNQLVGPDFRLIGAGFMQEPGGGSVVARRHTARDQFVAMDDRALYVFGYDPFRLATGVAAVGDRNAGSVASRFLRAGDGVPELQKYAVSPWHQCGFHIDQFVSVTGRLRNGRPLLLVADPHPIGESAKRQALDARKKLDLSAIALEDAGFEVIRNPIPFALARDSRKIAGRLFNNVILENAPRRGGDRPLVWLPLFEQTPELRTFEAVNIRIWRDIGYECKEITGFDTFVSRNGSIRCVTKTIKRHCNTVDFAK